MISNCFTKHNKLLNDYSAIASEAKYKTIHGKGRPSDLATRLKILTTKHIFQRLPITLVQVKANEIHQIIYSFVLSKRNY